MTPSAQNHTATMLFLALVLTSAINYMISTQLTHWLLPEQFAAFATFSALFWLVTLIPAALQQAVARNANPQSTLALAALQRWGWFVAVGVMVTSPFIANALHLPIWWLWLFGLITPTYTNLGIQRGYWQALAPIQLAQNYILELIIKVASMLILWQFIGWHSAVVSPLLAIVLVAFQPSKTKNQPTRHSGIQSDATAALTGMVGQTLIAYGDLILAQAFLPAQEAGVYAAVTLIGKVVFFAIQPIGTTIFARVAQSHDRKVQQQWLMIALGAGGLIGSSVTLISFIYGDWLASLLFGQAFVSSQQWLGWYALATSLNALAWLTCQHLFALGHRTAPWLMLFGAGLQTIGILFFHGTGSEIILVQVLTMGFLFAITMLHISQVQFGTKRSNAYVL